MHRPRTRFAAVVLGLVTLLFAGCAGLPGTSPPAPPPTSEPPAAPPSAPPSATGTGPSSGVPSAPASTAPSGSSGPSAGPSGSAPPAGPPAATREATIDGQRVTLDVFPIRRTGTLSVIDFTLTLPPEDPSAGAGETFLLTVQFDDRNSSTGDRSPYSVDAVRLIDAKNRKLYLVASDGRGNCLCSNGLNAIQVEPGQTYNFYATFASPPADVTEMEFEVPRFGAIPRVPVS